MALFLIVGDFTSERFRANSLHNFIINCRHFHRWWSNIPLVWIVEAELHVSEVTKLLEPNFDGANFLVTEINPFTTDGLLPEFAWDWFFPEEQNNRLRALAPPPTNKRGGSSF